jgi:hypothetical protein
MLSGLKKSNRRARIIRIIRIDRMVLRPQRRMGTGIKHKDTESRGDGTQGRYGTPIQHRGTEARRHGGTEAQREELNIELKIIICFFEFYVQFFPLCLCASVLNGRPIASLCCIPRDSVSLFESHVPLRLCDRRNVTFFR